MRAPLEKKKAGHRRAPVHRRRPMFESLEARRLPTTILSLGSDFEPQAINNLGHVIGFVESPDNYVDGYQAVSEFWSPTGGFQKLDFNATGLNDSDKVIGDQLLVSSMGGVYGFQTAVWTPSGGDQLLPNFPDNYEVSINNGDYVTGEEVPEDGLGPADIYVVDNLDTGKVGIPPSSDNIHFLPLPMNNAGDYAGYIDPDSQGGTSGFVASLANPGQVITALQGSLSGPADQLDGSINAINDSNQVVGEVAHQAVIWNGGTPTNLDFLSGGTESSAEAINDAGVVVGNSDSSASGVGNDRAFLWTKSGGTVDLNTLLPANSGWVLDTATGINNQGQVVGLGQYNGDNEGFVLTITPTSTALAPSWDAAKGTVDYSYLNTGTLTQPPLLTFLWSSTPTPTAASTPILATNGETTSSAIPLNGAIPGSDLSAPPVGTRFLVMEDTLGNVTNSMPVAYSPTIAVFDAEGTSAGETPTVFGRFFQNVSNPDESFVIGLSPDLAVLNQGAGGVVVQLNGQALKVVQSPTNRGIFATSTIDTGDYANGATLTTTVAAGGAGLAPVVNRLEILPLPTWVLKTLTAKDVEFDLKSGTYQIIGTLLNVKTSTLSNFALPAVAGLWLGTSFETGVDAILSVTVHAALNPLVKPLVETIQAGGSVTVLGNTTTLVPDTTIPLTLVPRTLALGAFQYTYVSPTKTATIPILQNTLPGGKPFTFGLPPFLLNPQANLSATVSYGAIVSITINPDGTLDPTQSGLSFAINAGFQGGLTLDSITTGSAVLDTALARLKSLINVGNPIFNPILQAAIVELEDFLSSLLGDLLAGINILPQFSGTATAMGTLNVGGFVNLGGPAYAPQLTNPVFHGNMSVSVPSAAIMFSFLGATYDPTVNLDHFFDYSANF